MAVQLELILGGARSGKSRLAEQRAIDSGLNKIYIATATAGDNEMKTRIQIHKDRRQQASVENPWSLIEEPLHLAQTLERAASNTSCILVDCLTLWLTNCLHEQCWRSERQALLAVAPKLSGRVLLVSNEVGLGVVPTGQISRQFVDEIGWLHQDLALLCQRVTFVTAGLPTELKPQ